MTSCELQIPTRCKKLAQNTKHTHTHRDRQTGTFAEWNTIHVPLYSQTAGINPGANVLRTWQVGSTPKNTELRGNTQKAANAVHTDCVELYLPLVCKHSVGQCRTHPAP